MEKWEYMTKFVYANITNRDAQELIQETWPGWNPAQYAPQTMIPELDELGALGWELVHMQPVAIGNNGDIMIHNAGTQSFTGTGSTVWSNGYFSVFKRRIEGSGSGAGA